MLISRFPFLCTSLLVCPVLANIPGVPSLHHDDISPALRPSILQSGNAYG
jgi:hypothetical protein